MIERITHTFRAFRADQSGAAMVEFGLAALFLPLVIAIVVAGGIIAATHQAASAGVRDAARYVARLAPPDLCETPGNMATEAAAFLGDAQTIVTERFPTANEQGNFWVLPLAVDPTDSQSAVVSVSFQPDAATEDYNVDGACVTVVEVRVRLTMDLPFGGVFGLLGGERRDTVTTEVFDRSRVYGL